MPSHAPSHAQSNAPSHTQLNAPSYMQSNVPSLKLPLSMPSNSPSSWDPPCEIEHVQEGGLNDGAESGDLEEEKGDVA